MHQWYAKTLVLAAMIVMIAIRAPHGQRSRSIPVVRKRKGAVEAIALTVALVAFALPLVWIATGFLLFADYPLRPIPLTAGAIFFALGLWLFHRAHADLGTNWSITLEVRREHQLVTHGIYRRVRHPMYLALLIYSLGQAFALPNWIAGPSYGVAMLILIALRLRAEEQLMLDTFGEQYVAYQATTNRLIPGVW
jgi:protein-S-isoprenylcysteine O-methyltransferase Ste14